MLHEHVNEPAVSVHVDCPIGQLCVLSVHSLLLLHVKPLPVKPGLQAHVNEPAVLIHVETAPVAQLCVFSVHSLLSAQNTPLPV